MNSKKKNIESQIVEDFEKIRPAITRLLQSQMGNENISIRYGRSRSNNADDIVINPSVLVGTISQSTLDKDEVLIGTVVHEAIHSMSNYKVDMSLISEYFDEDFNDVENILDVLEIMTGPFGKYIFDILIHSIEEKVFVNEYGGLNSILQDIYKESFYKTKTLTPFSQFLSLLFHSITLYINPEYKDFKKNVTEALNESLHLLKPLNYKEVNISEVLEASVQMVDICRRYNILPDLDKYNLGEQKEISQSLDESVINDLSKVLIPSSNNLTTGNTLQKFIGNEVDTKKDEKLNLMDDHISKVGASNNIYFPSGYTSKIVSSKLPENFKHLYSNGFITYENLLKQWNLPIFKVTNKIKPYFIHNQKRQRISGFDQGDLSPHVPIMLASGRYERMFEQKQRLSNKSYALSLLIDGSGSMIEKSKTQPKPWSLSAALIGASYLAQICFELNIDFEVSIFNRGFAADFKETESEYIKRKFAISSMLNTTYGSSAQEIFNTTNHYFVKEFNDSWRDNYEKFIGLIEFSRNLRSSIDSKLDQNLVPPLSMFEKGTNVDEVNIMHASKRLLTHPSNTKLLVVLSDGMTRGSIPELKNSINFAKKNKIEVIGVGIGNRGSWKEYENNIQVQHPEQLIYSIVNITKDILIKNIKTTIGAA